MTTPLPHPRSRVLRGATTAAQVGAVSLALLGLAYRATFYWMIPVPAGEPYGLADVLELYLVLALLAVSGLTVVLGAVLVLFPRLRSRRRGVLAVVVGTGSFAGYYLLHGAVPALM